MKILYSFILIILVSLSSYSQQAEFEFEKEIINYGKIKKGDNGKRVFKFTNIGKAPLMITEVKTSCDCAVPKKPEKPIMPGEKATITVSYDTSKIGGFSKIITIFSNAKISRKRLKIKGYIQKI